MANETTLLKYSLKTNIVKSIFFEVISRVSNFYYTFGRVTSWPTVSQVNPVSNLSEVISSEEDPPGIANTYSGELEARRDIVYSKLIDSNDIGLVVRRVNWTPGLVYDQYDDYTSDRLSANGAADISQAIFYVLTDDFNVYKCLYNNNGAQSIVKPFRTTTVPEKYSDGYMWKFMYTIPISLRNKFLTSTYMPVTTALTNQFYSRGSIISYVIEDRGFKYPINSYRVKKITVLSQGVNYSASDLTITFPLPTLSEGVQAIATVDEITSEGNVVSFKVNNETTTVAANASTIKIGHTYKIASVGNTNFVALGALGAPGTPSGTVGATFKATANGPSNTTGTVTSVRNSGYANQPLPTINSTIGSGLSIQVEYEVGEEQFTKLRVVGDGYNENNPYSLKSVTVTNGGEYDSILSGSGLVSFPAPGLETGNRPILDFIFGQKNTATGNVVSAAAIIAGKKYTIVTVGDTIWTNIGVTSVPGDPAPVPGRVFTATVNGPSNTTGTVREHKYEVKSVTVVDEGYGYTSSLVPIAPVGTASAGNVTFQQQLANGGFTCDFNISTQKNEAELVPLFSQEGEIEQILVKNAGIGYSFATVVIEAKKRVRQIEGVNESDWIYVDISNNPDDRGYIEGFNAGSILLQFGVGDIDTRQSNVELQAVNGSIPVVNVDYGGSGYPAPILALNENNAMVQTGGTTIQLIGDGIGWQGRPIVQNGVITGVDVLNAGAGYTYANVVLNPALSGAAGAQLRPIISPKGGHGKDSVAELYCNSVMLVTKLAVEKNKDIIASNDYRQVAIIKNVKSYGEDTFLRKTTASSCAAFICDKTSINTATYNILQLNNTLNFMLGSSLKTFTLVDKAIVNNKYYLLVQVNDSYIPAAGSSVFKQVDEITAYSISISSIQLPDFDKYSGEMLYLNNRVKFSPSDEQTIVASTLISF